MNRSTIEGQWNQLKGGIRQQWGKLTDDDIEFMEGSYERMVGRLQERYGYARYDIERQIREWSQQPG